VSVTIYSLLGEILTFAVLVWFIKRFLWGPLIQIMEDRKTRIADGLAAAEHGKREQELAEERAKELLHNAKQQAADIIARAEKRGREIIDEAKADARGEGERLITAAHAEIEQETNRVKEDLRGQVVSIAIAGASKVLEREVDEQSHNELLTKLAAEI
jgi:F-type H+-transporting ATPase subunit b